jgi:hypothetical protein
MIRKALPLILALISFLSGQEQGLEPSDEEKTKTTVRISGEINRPQHLNLPKGATLKDAISAAGGFTPGASKARIRIWNYKDQRIIGGQIFNYSKSENPILIDNSWIFIDSAILSEWPPDQVAGISGQKSLPYQELKKKLAPQIKGEWVLNYWKGFETLDVRMGAGREYRTYSIYRLQKDQQHPDPESGNPVLYSIHVHPRQPRGYDWKSERGTKAVLEALRAACQ